MTDTQLKSLIGCILRFKLNEFYITQVTDTHVHFCDNQIITIEEFKEHYLQSVKIYMTEDEDSLVSLQVYLEHYDIK